MQIKAKKNYKDNLTFKTPILYEYRMILITFLMSSAFFYLVRFLENHIYQIYVADYYSVIHTIIELISIIMYIASFLIILYVGDRDKRLRMKVLAMMLLFIGLIDFWHTFSYAGMPGVLVESSIQSATLFWIIGRLGFASGILLSSFISIETKLKNMKKWIITAVPFFLSLIFLVAVSYFPNRFPILFIEGYGLTTTKQVLEYVIIMMLIIAFINFAKEYNKTKLEVLPLFLSALIVSIFSEMAFISYFNVYDTYNLLGHIYKLIAAYMIFKVLFVFNINEPYNKLGLAEKEISQYANNLERLVNLRTEEINQGNRDMLRDIEYAKTIQKAIMSIKHKQYGNMEIYSEYIPYEKVGGDFYGLKDLNEKHLAFFIGDVAGHGIPAAMMTIFMNQTIVTEKIFQSGIQEVYAPNEVLKNLYKEYNETDFPLEMYAVMLYGVYNKETKKLVFSSAGLNTYPLVYKENTMVEIVEHVGFPICKIDKNYEPDFKNYEISLNKGHKMLFYTDGIIDVSNRKGETFGEQRLIKILRRYGHQSPEELSQKILDKLMDFTQGVKLNDDVHYLIMEVK